MTEQTVPVGATAVAEPPAPVLPPGLDDSGDDANRRKLMVVGGVVGVLVLLIAAFFLLKGGGSPNPKPFTLPPHHVVPAAAAPAQVRLPKHFNGKVGRDPFKALYVAPAPAASAGAAGSTSSTGSTAGSTTDVGNTGTPAAPATNPVWLQLVSVNGTSSATFVVGYSNGSSLTTKRFSNVLAPTSSTRTTFASVFALLAIHNGKATVQFGDGTPIDIAPGASNRLVVS